jgi:hypothetical protein
LLFASDSVPVALFVGQAIVPDPIPANPASLVASQTSRVSPAPSGNVPQIVTAEKVSFNPVPKYCPPHCVKFPVPGADMLVSLVNCSAALAGNANIATPKNRAAATVITFRIFLKFCRDIFKLFAFFIRTPLSQENEIKGQADPDGHAKKEVDHLFEIISIKRKSSESPMMMMPKTPTGEFITSIAPDIAPLAKFVGTVTIFNGI